jgi:hypothetical protein
MTTQEDATNSFSPFWPTFLMAVSLTVFLGWQVVSGARQYINLLRLGDQQTLLASQAAQAETNLQSIMMDLIKLGKTEPAAQAVINRYQIKFNAPADATLPAEAVVPEARRKAAAKPKAEEKTDPGN